MIELQEVTKQEYSGNNCKISSGYVTGNGIDTVYLKLEKDGVEPTLICVRPDELQAIIWVCSGTMWATEMDRLELGNYIEQTEVFAEVKRRLEEAKE